MIEKVFGARKTQRIHRFVRRSKVTFFCLLLTFVVLRGTIGAGKFGTPKQDILKIRNMYSRKHGEPHRLLEEVTDSTSSSFSHLRATTVSADGANYVAFSYAKLMSDVGGGKEISNAKIDVGDHMYVLGHKIYDWNQRRVKWLSEHPGFSNFHPRNNKPRILLIIGSSSKPCENPVGNHYLLKSIKNKINYSSLHEIDVFHNTTVLDAEMSGFWAKLPLIRRLMLAHPEVEFMWWMDSDVMFTNMTSEFPWGRYSHHNLVMHGWKEMVNDQENQMGLNTGSFLLRNCQWSLDLLDAWAPMGKIRDSAGKILSQEMKNMLPFEADDKIYVENGEEMIEKYHPGLGDRRWPLVTHFAGCKPCGKVGDFLDKECLKQMDRAFHLADNQVLKM